jgi:hypothetical protein
MEGTTSVMIPSKEELTKLKYKAGLLGINLSELFWNGAKEYKPKKNGPTGIENFFDQPCTLPEDFYSKRQWLKYISKTQDLKKLKKQVYWLAGELKI